MIKTPDDLMKLNASAVKASAEAAAKTLEGIEKLAELNLGAAKASLEEASARVKAMLAAKDAKSLADLFTSYAQPAPDAATAYAKNVYEISSKTGADLSAMFEKQIADANQQLFAAVDALGKSAPAGTEGAVSFLKQSLTAASSTYEQMNKATKQLFEIVEANFATAVKAPAKKAA